MRGNPVMKAKRVTGPTPNTVLCTRVVMERCSCGNPAQVVHVHGVHRVTRKCFHCGENRGRSPVTGIRTAVAAEMWWTRK
jgi:hypothetical protein